MKKIADVDGVRIKITGDSSEAVNEIDKVQRIIAEVNGKQIEFKISPVLKDAGEKLSQKLGSNIGEKSALKLKKSFRDIADEMNQVSQKFESGFGAILTGIAAKFAAIGGSIGILMKSALSIGGSFEAQMTTVKVISGATADELDQLTAKAREMGATLPISAKDAATAMTMLAQRGTNAKDILASVTDVANLAISQGVDMGTAAEMLGSTLTNFSIPIEEASKVTAIFNNASNQSALNISKMVEALKYIGPTAGSVKMELTEAMSGMEALANAGLTGEMIGTGLAAVLTKLASKSEVLGISTQEANGRLRSLSDIFSELQARGFSLAEATAIFGARGRLAALNLAKQSAALKENEERLKQWGSTQAAVDEKAKTFPNTMAAFHSAVEEFNIEIFEQIKGRSKEAVIGVTELVRTFSGWVGETKAAEDVVNGFFDGLGLKIPSGEEFKNLLKNFNVQEFAEHIKSFTSSVKDIGSIFMRIAKMLEWPLEFIIEHLELLGKITFWGWILDKGLAVPKALLNIVDAFVKLKNVLIMLNASLFAPILGFLSTDIGLGLGIGAGITYLVNQISGKISENRKAKAEMKRLQQETENADKDLKLNIAQTFKTGFEELPASYQKASDEARNETDKFISYIQDGFREKVASGVNSLIEKLPELSGSFNIMGQAGNEVLDLIEEHLNGDTKALEELTKKVPELKEKLKGLSDAEEIFGNITRSLNGDTEAFNSLKQRIKELQTNFQGIGEVSEKTLENIAKALKGDAEAFDVLPEKWKYVTEEIYRADSVAGQSQAHWLQMLHIFEKWKASNRNAESLLPENETKTLTQDITQGLSNTLNKLPAQIQRLQKFLTQDDYSLAINISLSSAYEEINKFAKETAEKLKIPEDIVKAGVLNQLKKLSSQGNETAQSLLNGWDQAGASLDNFLDTANDAVNYLNSSPEKFMPALNSLTKSIQKIDPLTGKVTEQFKKAHEALKQWSSVTFDQLSVRIQRLRKAVEGGFLNERALKEQFNDVLKQVTLKINTELEPTRNAYKSQGDYEAVVASEVFTKLQELGGDIFVKMLQEKFPSIAQTTGASMGRALLSEVQQVKSSGIQISGSSFTNQYNSPNQQVHDYTSNIAQVISELQKAASGITEVRENSQNNSANIQQISERMLSIENAIKNLSLGNNYEVNITQKDFHVENKADADYAAHAVSDAFLKAGLGNGSM